MPPPVPGWRSEDVCPVSRCNISIRKQASGAGRAWAPRARSSSRRQPCSVASASENNFRMSQRKTKLVNLVSEQKDKRYLKRANAAVRRGWLPCAPVTTCATQGSDLLYLQLSFHVWECMHWSILKKKILDLFRLYVCESGAGTQ